MSEYMYRKCDLEYFTENVYPLHIVVYGVPLPQWKILLFWGQNGAIWCNPETCFNGIAFQSMESENEKKQQPKIFSNPTPIPSAIPTNPPLYHPPNISNPSILLSMGI